MEFKAYKKKTLKIALILFLLIIVAIPLSIFIYLKYELPKLDGEIHLTAIKEKVEVYRDLEGIPHIYANNDEDAFYTLGYVIASERLFQMEISRRVASGELSEIIGERGLSSDKMFRNLKLRKAMEENLKNKIRDSKMLLRLSSFYRGVNEYQQNNPLPIEFKILNITPRPFSELDSYAFVGFMSFNFAIALNQDPLLTKLEKRLGNELVDELRAEKINSVKKNLFSLEKNAFDHSKISELISFLEKGYGLFEGSNGWLIAKNRSKSGANILANDPHISYSHPEIWFEAHIHTPQFETYGHFLPLIPFPILAHNQKRAWGLTMSLTDDMDLFREDLKENHKYVYKNKSLNLKISDEVIKVKGQKDYQFKLKETNHGPLLDQVLEDKNISLRWNYFDANNDPIASLYQMSEARNMAEFKAAVATGISPGLNVLYADHDNIAWWMFGKVETKPRNQRSDFILNGPDGIDDVRKTLSIDEKPHLENPISGIIVSANSRPENFPANQRGDFQEQDRFKTIQTVLNQKQLWSVEEIKELQTLSMNFENKHLLTELVNELNYSEKNKVAYNELKNWDLVSDVNSVGATLYFSLLNRVGLNLLSNELSATELETYGKMVTSYSFIKRVILDHDNPWWKKNNRKKLIQKSFDEVISSLSKKFGNNPDKWTWGKIHTLEFFHPLGKIKPLNLIFNLGPYPLSGASQDVNNQKSVSFKDEFIVNAGPSTRRIIDFKNLDETYGILPVGESGHILSPYYKNQVEKFINSKYRPMYLTRDLILKNQAHRLILRPN